MPQSRTEELPVIWIQGAGCTGCSVSLLNSVSPSIRNLLIDEVIPGKHISLKFHSTVMAGAGEPVIEVLEDVHKMGGYLLTVDGAIPTAGDGAYCSLGERAGKRVPFLDRFLELAERATAVIAMGTCAAFGGIPAAEPNPGQCINVEQALKRGGLATPFINVPGCPPHPDWFVGTVAHILLFGLPKPEELDDFHRPKLFYGKLIHEHCPRRAYYDEGKFAKKLSDPGCLYELGCKGPVTYADCPLRQWNNGINWCINSGGMCIGCVEPGFPDLMSPLYEKIAETS